MKIFQYDPETGRRGEQIDSVRLASWTDRNIEGAFEDGLPRFDYTVPKSTAKACWTVHVDAGTSGKDGKDISYQRDEWICFCLGEMVVGQGEGCWDWAVLPPKSLTSTKAA